MNKDRMLKYTSNSSGITACYTPFLEKTGHVIYSKTKKQQQSTTDSKKGTTHQELVLLLDKSSPVTVQCSGFFGRLFSHSIHHTFFTSLVQNTMIFQFLILV